MQLRLEEDDTTVMRGVEIFCEVHKTWHLFAMCTTTEYAQRVVDGLGIIDGLGAESGSICEEEEDSEEEIEENEDTATGSLITTEIAANGLL